MTALPVVGAVIALFVGQTCAGGGDDHGAGRYWLSRWLCGRDLPADGASACWSNTPGSPSLGIEYHLGVDGLGALMLVLSALVTLMSLDAAHRVHRQPDCTSRWCCCWKPGCSGRSPR